MGIMSYHCSVTGLNDDDVTFGCQVLERSFGGCNRRHSACGDMTGIPKRIVHRVTSLSLLQSGEEDADTPIPPLTGYSNYPHLTLKLC